MNLRIVRRIARTELATLFYSPIAWILLVVLGIQIGSAFGDIITEIIKIKAVSQIHFSATAGVVLGAKGIYEVIQQSIYLYIPLLTMNLMSREYSSGSDKLLYSSPVSSTEIIAGKFAAMLCCTAILTAVLALPAVTVCIVVPDADIPLMLSSLLSMFLLIMTYCSIGLFMSSLTSYQVVAAVATLTALAVFNFIGTVGQESPIFREITWWLSIKGRASEMVGGLICSEDVIYFLAVSAFFLALAVIRLDNIKISRTPAGKALRYCAAAAVLITVGYVSSRPALRTFHDATSNDARTLSKESQEVMKQLPGGMTITTYVDVQDSEFANYVPSKQMQDLARFKQYTRFKPEIRMKYVYYYSPITDTAVLNRYPGMSEEQIACELAAIKGYKHARLVSAESLKDQIDLAGERYQFVRVVRRQSGEEARLRLFNDMMHHPSEREISTAMKKMVNAPVRVATTIGHDERSIWKRGDRDYTYLVSNGQERNAMINQGFDLEEVDLSRDSIPSGINILLIADPLRPFGQEEAARIDNFIQRGGNLLVFTDAGHQKSINPILANFGIRAGETIDDQSNIQARATEEAGNRMKGFYKEMLRIKTAAINMPGAACLEVMDTSDFKSYPLLVTDSLDINGHRPLAVAAYRDRDGEKQQRAIIVADADNISNSFIQIANRMQNRSYNTRLLSASLRWLCYGEFPISTAHEPIRDKDISLTPMGLPLVKNIYCIFIPLAIGLLGIFILWRRRRR